MQNPKLHSRTGILALELVETVMSLNCLYKIKLEFANFFIIRIVIVQRSTFNVQYSVRNHQSLQSHVALLFFLRSKRNDE